MFYLWSSQHLDYKIKRLDPFLITFYFKYSLFSTFCCISECVGYSNHLIHKHNVLRPHSLICLFLIFILYLTALVLVVAHGVFDASCGIFRCSLQTLLLVPRLTSCGTWALLLWHMGPRVYQLSSCSALSPERTGFNSCSTWAQLFDGMWDLSSLTRN